MEGLLFESSVAFEGAREIDKIRQSLIDMDVDPPECEEVVMLFQEARKYMQRDLPSDELEDLSLLIAACFAKYPGEMIPDMFNEIWKDRKSNLSFAFCNLCVLSKMLEMPEKEKLPDDYLEFANEAIKGCDMNDKVELFGMEVPPELHISVIFYCMTTAKITEKSMETFARRLFLSDLSRERIGGILRAVAEADLMMYLPFDLFIQPGIASKLSNEHLTLVVENVPDEAFRLIWKTICDECVLRRNAGVSHAFICRLKALDTAPKQIGRLFNHLSPADITPRTWGFLEGTAITLSWEKAKELVHLPEPLFFMKICKGAWSLLPEKTVSQVLNDLSDWETVKRVLTKHLRNPVLRTKEFWIAVMKLAPSVVKKASNIRQCFSGNVPAAAAKETLNAMLFEEFPPPENHCALILALSSVGRRWADASVFEEAGNVRTILEALPVNGDKIMPPSKWFWGLLVLNVEVVSEMITSSKVPSIFVDGLAQLLWYDSHVTIPDIDLMTQTPETAEEILAYLSYVSELDEDLVAFQQKLWSYNTPFSPAAFSVISAAHLSGSVRMPGLYEQIDKGVTITGLDPYSLFLFVAVWVQTMQLNSHHPGERVILLLSPYRVHWMDALELMFTDELVARAFDYILPFIVRDDNSDLESADVIMTIETLVRVLPKLLSGEWTRSIDKWMLIMFRISSKTGPGGKLSKLFTDAIEGRETELIMWLMNNLDAATEAAFACRMNLEAFAVDKLAEALRKLVMDPANIVPLAKVIYHVCGKCNRFELDDATPLSNAIVAATSAQDWDSAEALATFVYICSLPMELDTGPFSQLPADRKIRVFETFSGLSMSADVLVSLFNYAEIDEVGAPQLPRKSAQHLDRPLAALLMNCLVDSSTVKANLTCMTETMEYRSCLRTTLMLMLFRNMYQDHMDAFLSAVVTMYDMPPNTNMLLLRPEPAPLEPISGMAKNIVDGLLTTENPTFMTFYWLKVIANHAIFLFTDKRRAIEFAHKGFSSGFETYFIKDEPGDDTVPILLSGAAVAFLSFVLFAPDAMDVYVPWFFANAHEMTDSQIFGHLLVFHANMCVVSIQHVLTALMMKSDSWILVLTDIYSRKIECKSWRAKILDQAIQITALFYKCINSFNINAACTADELAKCDTPFQTTFDHSLIILCGVDRPMVLGKIKDWTVPCGLVSFWDYIQFEQYACPQGSDSSGLEEFNAALRNCMPACKPYTGTLPDGIDRDTFNTFPLKLQSTVLHHSLPQLPSFAEFNSEMVRFLVHTPMWICQWLSKPQSLLLAPESYGHLMDAMLRLQELRHADIEDMTVEDFTLDQFCHGDLFELMLHESVFDTRNATHESLFTVFTEISKSAGLIPTLERIDVILRSGATRPILKQVIEILQAMSEGEYFASNFLDLCAPLLLDIVCEVGNRWHGCLLVRISRLFGPLGEEMPGRIIHVIVYMLMSKKPRVIKCGLDLCSKIGQGRKENAMPYIHAAFDSALSSADGEFQCVVTYILEQFPEVAVSRQAKMIVVLRERLSEYKEGPTDLIGALFSALAPARGSSHSVRWSDSHSIEASPSMPSTILPIPSVLVQQAPEFWSVVADFRKLVNQIVLNDPHLIHESFRFLEQYPELMDFTVRVVIFRDAMQDRLSEGTFNLAVRRSYILDDSFARLASVKTTNLMSNLQVRFIGEEGVDAGGVRRDWFSCLVKKVFNPDYALFMATLNGRSYEPNPLSTITANHLQYFNFAGKIMARALVEGVNVDAHLTTAFCKHVLQSRLSLRDLEAVDPELHKSLAWILENDIDEACLDIDFTTVVDSMGQQITRDLKSNGSHIAVTNENKEEYVRLRCDLRLKEQVIEQIEAFRIGFYSIIPLEYIRGFSANEFDLLICGVPEIDVEDMRKHCRYHRPYHAKHPVIIALFAAISKWENEALAKLLLFMTGSSQLPVQGFKYFSDIGQPITIAPGGEVGRLPAAHTCMNTLDLPEYQNVDELNAKLTTAVEECDSFGFV